MCTANTTQANRTANAAAIRAARGVKGCGIPDIRDQPVQCVRCECWSEKRKCAAGVCVICQMEAAATVANLVAS